MGVLLLYHLRKTLHMKNKILVLDILLVIVCNIIPFLILCFTDKIELSLLIMIILFFLYYIYLLIKNRKSKIDYKIIISLFLLLVLEILLVYFFSDKVGFVVSEDLSNITLTFGVFSFFMINVFCILILVFTNLIKMCLKKLKSS